MKTSPLKGINYDAFKVTDGAWRDTRPLKEPHLHDSQSPIHDAIWHAAAATGIDPALLTAIHATETQGHIPDINGDYETPHYGVEKDRKGNDHIGYDQRKDGTLYAHTFGPFQISEEAFKDAWQGKYPAELSNYHDIEEALLRNPYIAAMTAAKYITLIRNREASHSRGMTQTDSSLKALITAALYNRGVGHADTYKGLRSLDDWVRNKESKEKYLEYGPRVFYNYKKLGGTYNSLASAIQLGTPQSKPAQNPEQEMSRSLSAHYANVLRLEKALRRQPQSVPLHW